MLCDIIGESWIISNENHIHHGASGSKSWGIPGATSSDQGGIPAMVGTRFIGQPLLGIKLVRTSQHEPCVYFMNLIPEV